MPYLFHLALLAVLAVFAGALPQRARADAQVSIRNFLELGKRKADAGDEFIVGLGAVGDVMFGAPHTRAFRIGPAVEFRSVDFASLEAAAGGGILIPLPGDAPIGIYGLVGAAARRHAPDGMVGIGKVTYGFRGYNYHGWYAYGLNVYGAGRKHIGDEKLIEWTGGVEVDVQFTAFVPVVAIRNFIMAKDPYEEEADEEKVHDEPPAEEAERPARRPSSDEEDEEEEDEGHEAKSQSLDDEKPPALKSSDEDEDEEDE